VAYSRPIRRKGKKPGPLTSVLVWFIVKPLELIFRGLAKLFTVRSRSNTEQARSLPHGWYQSPGGWIYWSGQTWYDLDGRAIF
jgi:hypothetical protein